MTSKNAPRSTSLAAPRAPALAASTPLVVLRVHRRLVASIQEVPSPYLNRSSAAHLAVRAVRAEALLPRRAARTLTPRSTFHLKRHARARRVLSRSIPSSAVALALARVSSPRPSAPRARCAMAQVHVHLSSRAASRWQAPALHATVLAHRLHLETSARRARARDV